MYISPYPGPRVWRAYPLAEGTYPHTRVHTRVWNLQGLTRGGSGLGCSIPGYVPGHEGMYPPPEGMLSIPWAQGMVKCTLIKTLKQNYNGGYALHHNRVHTLLHTPYPAREGMRVWGMEHPRLRWRRKS